MDKKLIRVYLLKRAKKLLEDQDILEQMQLQSINTKIASIKKEQAVPAGR